MSLEKTRSTIITCKRWERRCGLFRIEDIRRCVGKLVEKQTLVGVFCCCYFCVYTLATLPLGFLSWLSICKNTAKHGDTLHYYSTLNITISMGFFIGTNQYPKFTAGSNSKPSYILRMSKTQYAAVCSAKIWKYVKEAVAKKQNRMALVVYFSFQTYMYKYIFEIFWLFRVHWNYLIFGEVSSASLPYETSSWIMMCTDFQVQCVYIVNALVKRKIAHIIWLLANRLGPWSKSSCYVFTNPSVPHSPLVACEVHFHLGGPKALLLIQSLMLFML